MFSIFSSVVGFEKFDYDAPYYRFLHAWCMSSFFKLLLYMWVIVFIKLEKCSPMVSLHFFSHSSPSGDLNVIHARE